ICDAFALLALLALLRRAARPNVWGALYVGWGLASAYVHGAGGWEGVRSWGVGWLFLLAGTLGGEGGRGGGAGRGVGGGGGGGGCWRWWRGRLARWRRQASRPRGPPAAASWPGAFVPRAWRARRTCWRRCVCCHFWSPPPSGAGG